MSSGDLLIRDIDASDIEVRKSTKQDADLSPDSAAYLEDARAFEEVDVFVQAPAHK
jgi:hypothetical protein